MLAADGWHPGVIGIVASRIAERHHRPAVLIALDGEEGTGSGRSIPAFDLLAGLQAASADLLRHGGHRAAAGLTIARGRVDAFREAFVAHAAATLTPDDLVPVQRVDAVVPGDALHLGLAEELERLAPFGMGNPEPALLVPGALLGDPRPMGEGRHVSFTLAAGGARSRCVAFGRGSSLPAAPGEPVDAAVRLEVNRYNGAVEPRLVLRHAQPARPAPIEVIGEAGFEVAVMAELERDLGTWPPRGDPRFADDLRGLADGLGRPEERALRDARGGGIAGLLGDLVAGGAPVLAVTAHARQRACRAARPRRRIRRHDLGGARAGPVARCGLRARRRGRPAAARAPADAGGAAPRRRLDAPRLGRGRAGAGAPRAGLGAGPPAAARRRLPSAPGRCPRRSVDAATCSPRPCAAAARSRAPGPSPGGCCACSPSSA